MESLSGPGSLAALTADMGQAITDAELVAASRRGEREAFGHLVERYLGLVCAVSYSSTRNQALSEDVAQETFLAAWAQLDSLRETSRVRSWLCGIARNLARKARLRGARETPALLDDGAPAAWSAPTATPFEAASAAETERLVWSALDHVPAAYREVLVLYYQQQRSLREVAHALGISEDAALQRLTRGRRHLAGQVTDLVEQALEGSRPRRGLAAAVMAALPPFGALGAPSGSIAWPKATNSPAAGAKMFKIVFAVLAGAGVAGGATYVATRPSAPATSSPAAAREAAAPPEARAAAAIVPPVGSAAAVRLPSAPPKAPPGPVAVNGGDDDGSGGGSCEPDPTVPPEGDQLDPEDLERTALYQGPSRGPADAPVQIAIYQDLKCQFCEMVLGTIDQLMDEYPGQLRLVVKQFPVHDSARLAAEASMAADAQGKFWEFHDRAMAFNEDLSREALIELATQGGLDVAAFTRALDRHTYANKLAAEIAAGQSLDVQGTPAFFINGKRFTGAQPIDKFRAAIDAALAARRPAP